MSSKRNLPARVTAAMTRAISFGITGLLLPARLEAERGCPEPSDVRTVLVVRADEIGDVVMTSPFLRELRRNLTTARISLVVKPEVRNLVEHCPYVDEILTFDWSTSTYWWPLQNYLRAARFAQEQLMARRFDLAIVPRWDTDWYHASFIAHFSRARYRLGYAESVNARKQRFNRGYDHLFSHTIFDDRPRHEVERGLALLAYLGWPIASDRLELWTTPEDEAFADQVLKNAGIRADETLIAFGIGARHARRKWPVERFAELGQCLRAQYPCRILVTGDRSDAALAVALRSRLDGTVIDMAGRTTLRQSAALFKRCRLFIGNDSGPKHIAAAAGVPIVEISWCSYGSRSSANSTVNRFRPWDVPHRIVSPHRPIVPCAEECTAAESHCIRGVTVEMMQEAIRGELSSSRGPGS